MEGLGDRPLGLEVTRAVQRLCTLARQRPEEDAVVRGERARLVPAELEGADAPPCGDERDDEEAAQRPLGIVARRLGPPRSPANDLRQRRLVVEREFAVPLAGRHAMRCERSRDPSLRVDGVQGRCVRVDVLYRSLDDDVRDFDERHGVGELRGRSLQQLGALPQPLFLVVELAALERESALGHHRLELTALRVAQVALLTERDVDGAVDSGRGLERHRYPAGVLERRSTRERVHVVGRERPHRLAARDRARERDVGVQPDGTPRLDGVLRVADIRDHLYGGAAGAGENDEAGLGADEPQRVRQARFADVGAARGERERGRDLL